jgi:hypothetical protein
MGLIHDACSAISNWMLSVLGPDDLRRKSRGELEQLARDKGFFQDPKKPNKWRDPASGDERMRIDPGDVDPRTGLPYNNPRAAQPQRPCQPSSPRHHRSARRAARGSAERARQGRGEVSLGRFVRRRGWTLQKVEPQTRSRVQTSQNASGQDVLRRLLSLVEDGLRSGETDLRIFLLSRLSITCAAKTRLLYPSFL